jgi:hypothetical protein
MTIHLLMAFILVVLVLAMVLPASSVHHGVFGMFHTVAWEESIDPGNALVTITAVPDAAIFTSGDDVRVPRQLPFLIGAACMVNDASLSRAQLQAPSLRSFANLDIEPVVNGLTFGEQAEVLFHPSNPIPLDADESLNAAFLSDPAAAVIHRMVAWLADGPQQPVNGEIFSVRATSSITLAAATWVAGELAFTQTLPVGNYRIVGWRARSTNGVAARLNFRGGSFRPGVPCVNAIGEEDLPVFRYGRCGVFGEFHTNTPPQVEVLGVTDTAQVHIFDLIRVG